jgi:hypothetical protein
MALVRLPVVRVQHPFIPGGYFHADLSFEDSGGQQGRFKTAHAATTLQRHRQPLVQLFDETTQTVVEEFRDGIPGLLQDGAWKSKNIPGSFQYEMVQTTDPDTSETEWNLPFSVRVSWRGP